MEYIAAFTSIASLLIALIALLGSRKQAIVQEPRTNATDITTLKERVRNMSELLKRSEVDSNQKISKIETDIEKKIDQIDNKINIFSEKLEKILLILIDKNKK